MKTMTPQRFRNAIENLWMIQAEAAAIFGVSTRTVERWATGETPVPKMIAFALIYAEKNEPFREALVTSENYRWLK